MLLEPRERDARVSAQLHADELQQPSGAGKRELLEWVQLHVHEPVVRGAVPELPAER